MSLAARDRMTADEFFAIPDELPRAQLIDGELVVPVPATFHHDGIVVTLTHLFRLHRRAHPDAGRLGINGGVRIDEHNAFVPDAFWVPADRVLPPDTGVFPEPPALVVEVRSPSTWRLDRGHKLRGYERVGVAEVWLVDPRREGVVTAHRRSGPDTGYDVVAPHRPGDTLATPLVPGWEVDVRELLAPG